VKIKFHSLKAKKGDAFVIEWADRNAILIDGGTPNTYSEIVKVLKPLKLLAVFITHVDKDHIGGIIHLINKTNVDISNTQFYMNHPDLFNYYSGEKVRYEDGDSLKNILGVEGKLFKQINTSENATICVQGLDIKVLSPAVELVGKLNKNWTASSILKDGKLDYLQRQVNNGDIINKSSVAKLVSYGGIKILLLADSHPDIIVESLKDLGYSKNNPLNVDLIKLSHHGSRYSTSNALLEIAKTKNYYISTNGAGNSYHPHSEIIEMLKTATKNHNYEFAQIYLNYPIAEKIKLKMKSFPTNLKLVHKQTVVL
jgi:beta-lactamase superfamily II metal-dependent hydrolase